MQPLIHSIECPDPGGQGSHQMVYYEWPNFSARKTVVCVHGLTRQGRDFDFLAQDLMRDYRVICPDVAGRGKSSWLRDRSQYHYGTYVADMIVFMETLGLKDVYWVGTSMGGLIGMVLAATYPEYISRLVMNDIGPMIPQDALKRLAQYAGQPVQFDKLEDGEKWLKETLAPWGIEDRLLWRHMAEHSFKLSGGKYVPHYDTGIRDNFAQINGDVEMWDLWGQVKCPTLVLRGTMSDVLTQSTAKRMVSPGRVELLEFPNVGHCPALMQQAQISKVKQWLMR